MTINKSNLHYFFLFLLLCLVFCSCSSSSEEEEIIPSVYVNGTIYLNFHSELNSVGNALYFDEIGTSTGYQGHGFIVIRTSTTEFSVFDASCTHDKDEMEHVEINGTFAECPICNSKFSLLTGGWPFNNSVAKTKLKEYRNSYSSSSNTLNVRN